MRHKLIKSILGLLCYGLSASMVSATLLHATGSWTTETTDNAELPGPYGGTFSFFLDDAVIGDEPHIFRWSAPLTSFAWIGSNYGGFDVSNVEAWGLGQGGQVDGPATIRRGTTADCCDGDGFSVNLADYVNLPFTFAGNYWLDEWDAPANGIDEVGTLQWAEVTNFVGIDIDPRKDSNIINLRSRGFVAVAVLTEGEFDAVQLNPGTARLGPATTARYRVKDIDKDGDEDLVLYFKIQQTGIDCDHAPQQLTLTGELYDGAPVAGTDSIQTKNCQ